MLVSRAAEQPRPQAELNITPLIDVMLVLLIIFMVAIPAITKSIDLKLPFADPTPVDQVRAEPIHVQLHADGRVALNGEAMSKAQLDYALRANSLQEPQPPVQIAVADGTRYDAVAGLVARTRSAGLKAITLEP